MEDPCLLGCPCPDADEFETWCAPRAAVAVTGTFQASPAGFIILVDEHRFGRGFWKHGNDRLRGSRYGKEPGHLNRAEEALTVVGP